MKISKTINNFSIKQFLFTKNKKQTEKVLPIVTTPLVLYLSIGERENERNKKIAEEAMRIAKPVTDRVEFNSRQLRSCNISEADIKNYLKIDGRVTEEGKKILKEHHKSFKGLCDDTPHDIADINSDSEYIGDIPTIAETESPIEHDTEIIDGLDLESIPIIGSTLAEALPGTKYLKPITKFCQGDVKKAAIGISIRAAEIAVAPIKFGYIASCGACSALYKLCGIDEDYTGFLNGIKIASENWSNARDKIEDAILGRENKSKKEKRLETERQKNTELLEETVKQPILNTQPATVINQISQSEAGEIITPKIENNPELNPQKLSSRQIKRIEKRKLERAKKLEEEKRIALEKKLATEEAIKKMQETRIAENKVNKTKEKKQNIEPDVINIKLTLDERLELIKIVKLIRNIQQLSELDSKFNIKKFLKSINGNKSIDYYEKISKSLQKQINDIKKNKTQK